MIPSMDFEMYLANVNSTNNKFYNEEKLSFSKDRTKRDIERYLKREILRSHDEKGEKDEKFPLVICANDEKWDAPIG